MKLYRVYQNLTQYATFVKAKTQKEAIKKAKESKDTEWDEYEPIEENVFYDAVEWK